MRSRRQRRTFPGTESGSAPTWPPWTKPAGSAHVPDAVLAIRDGRIAWVGTRRAAGCDYRGPRRDRNRRARPVDHARPDRMPHPPRVRRRSQQRVRGASARRHLRRHRARRRRNRLDHARHARRRRRRTARTVAAPRAGAGKRRRDDARSEVGLRARSRERAEDAARRASGSASNSASTWSRPSSARTRCRRSSRTDRTSTCATSATTCFPRSQRSSSPKPPTCSASESLSRASRPNACSNAHAVSAWGCACTPTS